MLKYKCQSCITARLAVMLLTLVLTLLFQFQVYQLVQLENALVYHCSFVLIKFSYKHEVGFANWQIKLEITSPLNLDAIKYLSKQNTGDIIFPGYVREPLLSSQYF